MWKWSGRLDQPKICKFGLNYLCSQCEKREVLDPILRQQQSKITSLRDSAGRLVPLLVIETGRAGWGRTIQSPQRWICFMLVRAHSSLERDSDTGHISTGKGSSYGSTWYNLVSPILCNQGIRKIYQTQEYCDSRPLPWGSISLKITLVC